MGSAPAPRLVIVTPVVGRNDGQGRVNYEVAVAALRRGLRVRLLARDVDADVLAGGAEWVPVRPWPGAPALVANRAFALLAARRLRRRPGDVVLANGACLAAERHELNAVHFVHTSWLASEHHVANHRGGAYGAYQRAYTALNARWERDAFRRARTVVAVSDRVRDDLVAAGCRPGDVRVVLNGVDLDEFAPGPADRGALGLPPGVPLALFAGDIRSPRKNLGTVLRALAGLPAVHLAVAGATEGSPYPSLAERLGVADRVRFLGFRADVADLMRAADVFVFPSRYETLGLVVLEAMSSGLPVVTATTTAASDLVRPTFGRVVDDPDDADALAEAVGDVLADGSRRAEMARSARAAAEGHSWARMAGEYLELVDEAAGGHRRP